MRRWVIIGGALALLSGACTGDAMASGFGVGPSAQRLAAGRTASLTIRLDDVDGCTAVAPLPAAPARFATAGMDSVTLAVSAPRALRNGTYRVRVACDALPVREVAVRVSGPARTTRSSARIRLRVVAAHVRYVVASGALDLARAAWLQTGSRSLKYYRDGQCTDWAVQRRPDVVERVYEASYVAAHMHLPLRGLPASGHLGPARTWPKAAAAAGMTVRSTPAVGALVVWGPGVEGASTVTGHIGYVEALSADGSSFATSEMHAGQIAYQMSYRTLSSIPVRGRSFIWPG